MKRLSVVLVMLSCIIAASSAHALTMYQTTLNLVKPVNNSDGIDKVVYNWSSNLTSGHVGTSDLVDFSMQLFSGGSLVYQDIAMIGSVVQPIGGVARTSANIYWNFDLDVPELFEMGNVGYPTQIESTSGTQYFVTDNTSLDNDSQVYILRYDDGVNTNFTYDILASQSTSVVPEPSTFATLGLGLLGMLGFLRKRKSKA